MLEQLKILTVTHKQTNLKNLGDFVIKTAEGPALEAELKDIKQRFALDELMYLATCNRVMYLFVTEKEITGEFVPTFFRQINPRISDDSLTQIAKTNCLFSGNEAIAHLFEVAASMDSMVIGERQILGQLRDAYDQCHAWGLTGDGIRLAFQHAVLAAKEVYSQTRIGEKPVSVASLAIQQLLRLHLPHDARILMIGAGQTNTLVAKFLHKHHFNNVTVFNRTVDKANNIAQILGGRALPLSALTGYSEGFDCLIICTGLGQPVITSEVYTQLLNGETDTKIIIDLAIPHNVAPEVTAQFPIHYIEIEGLRYLSQDNHAFRERELHKAKALLDQQVAAFPGIWKQRQLERALGRIPAEIKSVREKALNEVFRKEVNTLDERSREILERMLEYMEKKCIGIPMKAAREAIAM